MLVLEWKERTFFEKVNSRCFCWFPAAILVHQNGTPIWRPMHTKLFKRAWKVSANNSETVGRKDLRLGKIVYILVFYNISFSWLLPLDGFQFIFFVAWQWKRSIAMRFERDILYCSLQCKHSLRGRECLARESAMLKLEKRGENLKWGLPLPSFLLSPEHLP